MRPRLPFAAAMLGLALAAHAHIPAQAAEDAIRPGQYSAVLEQHAQRWRLLPPDGSELRMGAAEGGCASGRLPSGLWLLTRDTDGRFLLRAPSVTALPAGFPEDVPLRACTSPDAGPAPDAAPQLLAPPSLIEWLGANGGAIWVRD